MRKIFAFGAGFGAAVQAWRQWPPDHAPSVWPAVVVFIAAVACAYYGGRSRRGSVAIASATAVAVSESNAAAHAQGGNVQVLVVAPGGGAAAQGVSFPDESVAWLGPAHRGLDADELDGADLAELLEPSDDLAYLREEAGET